MKQEQSFFDSVYNSSYQKVFRICMGYSSGDETIAKDLAQEVFIKVWENISSFRNESNISTWIYRIAVNTCLLELRRKKYRNTEISENTVSPEEEISSIEISNQFKKMYSCIEELSEDNKAIILLELEGLPQKEIADIIGVSHEAIRVRVHRIKSSLTKCVQK